MKPPLLIVVLVAVLAGCNRSDKGTTPAAPSSPTSPTSPKQGVYTDAAMQRAIRIGTGASVDVDLAPHDVSYDLAGGLRCDPCKVIRVVSAQAGRLQLQATWKEARATLNLWVNGRLSKARGPVDPVRFSPRLPSRPPANCGCMSG